MFHAWHSQLWAREKTTRSDPETRGANRGNRFSQQDVPKLRVLEIRVRAAREADLNLSIASVLHVGVYDAFKRKRDARPRSPRKFREGGKELCSEGLMVPLAQCRATRAHQGA